MNKVHIILADDDPDECMIFSQVLKEVIPHGEVTCVENCKELLDYLEKLDGIKDEKVQPDLVFLDLNMPMMAGHECLKNVVENKFRNKIPIIVYSTASREHIVEQCYEIGASMYVVKPTDIKKLKETIAAVVKKFIGVDR